MQGPVLVAEGAEKWTVTAVTVKSWITLGYRPDGSYGPVVDTAKAGEVHRQARAQDRPPRQERHLPPRQERQDRRRDRRPHGPHARPGRDGGPRRRGAPRARRRPHGPERAGRARVHRRRPGAHHRAGHRRRAPHAADLDVDHPLRRGPAERLLGEHHDPREDHRRDGRRAGRGLRLLEGRRHPDAGAGLHVGRRDHQRPLGRRPARSPAASARAPRRSSTPPSAPGSRSSSARRTTTTSRATRSVSTPRSG